MWVLVLEEKKIHPKCYSYEWRLFFNSWPLPNGIFDGYKNFEVLWGFF
jgi:hypothetical protein